jgi:hypothetical protein
MKQTTMCQLVVTASQLELLRGMVKQTLSTAEQDEINELEALQEALEPIQVEEGE